MKRVFALALVCCLLSAAAVRAESPFPSMLELQPPAVGGAYADDDALVRAAVKTLRGWWQQEFAEGRYAPGDRIRIVCPAGGNGLPVPGPGLRSVS